MTKEEIEKPKAITRTDFAVERMKIMNDYANAQAAYELAIERLRKMGLC